ncbi:hypothetical protein [Burkholderia cenocepacia]|uniref:hypothetical protein n=1 Tax=Burkholderia cenocepacia TaxID=95486 RepID=UPI0007617424|nr:hypothetical protein [Burkholderia cenocepacia]KWU26411.1 hypothetical protein AS149_25830 [Burkholderia cenocepacia]
MRPRRRGRQSVGTQARAAAPSIAYAFINRRESGWISAATPPVVEGEYLTRGAGGLRLLVWARARWRLARDVQPPVEWRGIDVELTDVERQMLSTRLYHDDIVAALPLLRDAVATYLAESATEARSLLVRREQLRLLYRVLRLFLMLKQSPEGAALLTPLDRKVVMRLSRESGVKKLEQRAKDSLIAFKQGIDL